jgi:hypothetical protein
MRPTRPWTKVLAQVISFSLLSQTATPAFASNKHHNYPSKTVERRFFGPTVYARTTNGKPTKFREVFTVPTDVKGPFTLRITQEGRVNTSAPLFGRVFEISREESAPVRPLGAGPALEIHSVMKFSMEPKNQWGFEPPRRLVSERVCKSSWC